jgi:type II secretory pathway component PulM
MAAVQQKMTELRILDKTAAFDTVDHATLQQRIETSHGIGISGNALSIAKITLIDIRLLA